MENIIEYFDTVHAPALILTLDAQENLNNLASILLNRLCWNHYCHYFLFMVSCSMQQLLWQEGHLHSHARWHDSLIITVPINSWRKGINEQHSLSFTSQSPLVFSHGFISRNCLPTLNLCSVCWESWSHALESSSTDSSIPMDQQGSVTHNQWQACQAQGIFRCWPGVTSWLSFNIELHISGWQSNQLELEETTYHCSLEHRVWIHRTHASCLWTHLAKAYLLQNHQHTHYLTLHSPLWQPRCNHSSRIQIVSWLHQTHWHPLQIHTWSCYKFNPGPQILSHWGHDCGHIHQDAPTITIWKAQRTLGSMSCLRGSVGIASDNVLWCCNDEKPMRHHKKHASWHVESFLTYHFRLNLCIILLYKTHLCSVPAAQFLFLQKLSCKSLTYKFNFLHCLYTYIQYFVLYYRYKEIQFLISPETELHLCCTIAFHLPSSHLYQKPTQQKLMSEPDPGGISL